MKSMLALAASSALFILVPLTILIAHDSRATPAINTPVRETRQEKRSKGLHVVKVIEAESGSPVPKATVAVELEDSSKRKWAGSADSNGVFVFTCELANGSVKAHISIEATGFWTLDDHFPLVEARIIQLRKAD